LPSIWSRFLRALKPSSTTTTPGNNVSRLVGDTDNSIVIGRVNIYLTLANLALSFLFLATLNLRCLTKSDHF
jgi:hypothetical protein